MGTVTFDDEIIALGAIENDPPLRDRLIRLPPGAVVLLDVSGRVGRWERARPIRNGVPVEAILPLDLDAALFARWQREERQVELWPVGLHETHLATFEEQLHRWDTAQNRLGGGRPAPLKVEQDDYLSIVSAALSEWHSVEERTAFDELPNR